MFYTSRDMQHSHAPEEPSHKAIISRNGGPAAVGRGIGVDPNTVKAWNRNDSIPSPHWLAIATAEMATLDELAAAAARRAAA